MKRTDQKTLHVTCHINVPYISNNIQLISYHSQSNTDHHVHQTLRAIERQTIMSTVLTEVNYTKLNWIPCVVKGPLVILGIT